MKDSRIKLSLILLIIMLTFTIVATYAYFTSPITGDDFGSVEIESAQSGLAHTINGSEIGLKVEGNIMSQDNISTTVPAVTASNITPIKIVLNTSGNGGELKCNYDVVYEPSIPFMNSALNISNVNEYTIKGSGYMTNDVSGTKDLSIPETNLGNVTSRLMLLENQEISVTGVSKTLEYNWEFTVSFYNQEFNQDDNTNISFGGKIILDDVNCENVFVNQ